MKRQDTQTQINKQKYNVCTIGKTQKRDDQKWLLCTTKNTNQCNNIELIRWNSENEMKQKQQFVEARQTQQNKTHIQKIHTK